MGPPILFTSLYRWLIMGTCRSIINIPKTKSVVQDPSSPDNRLVLFRVPEFCLSPCPLRIVCELMSRLKKADLSEPVQDFLKTHDATGTTHDITLDYDLWNAGGVVSPCESASMNTEDLTRYR